MLRIRRIRLFLGLPNTDPLVRGTDPEPDPSIIKKNSKKNLDSYCFVISLWLFIFDKWCKCTFKKYGNKQKTFLLPSWKLLTKIAGSGAGTGSVSLRYESGSVQNCHGSATLPLSQLNRKAARDSFLLIFRLMKDNEKRFKMDVIRSRILVVCSEVWETEIYCGTLLGSYVELTKTVVLSAISCLVRSWAGRRRLPRGTTNCGRESTSVVEPASQPCNIFKS